MSQVSPFDAIAAAYDSQFTHTGVGQAQRELVKNHLRELLAGGVRGRVLELNAGTGEDALWLASQGMEVTATDASAGMVTVMVQKASLYPQGKRVECRQLAFDQVSGALQEPVDLVFSNFGGLNCVPVSDWEKLAHDLLSVTQPRARLVIVLISANCVWETLYFLSRLKPRAAFRRWRGQAVARLEDGVEQMTYYPTQRQVRKAFAAHWQVKAIRPVGLWVPPSFLEPWARRHPGIFGMLVRWEHFWRSRALASRFSDHYLIDLERTA